MFSRCMASPKHTCVPGNIDRSEWLWLWEVHQVCTKVGQGIRLNVGLITETDPRRVVLTVSWSERIVILPPRPLLTNNPQPMFQNPHPTAQCWRLCLCIRRDTSLTSRPPTTQRPMTSLWHHLDSSLIIYFPHNFPKKWLEFYQRRIKMFRSFSFSRWDAF